MFKFSCFPAHLHSNKQKKTVQLSTEAMHKTREDCPQNHSMKGFPYSSTTSGALEGDGLKNYADHASDYSSLERDCRSEEFKSKSNTGCEVELRHTSQMRKSLSLGSCLNLEGRVFNGNDSDHESGRFSGSESHDGGKEVNNSLHDLFQEDGPSNSVQVNSDLGNNDSVFSIGDAKESGKSEEEKNSEVQLSNANESGGRSPHTPPIIVKSTSLPNIQSPGRQFSHNFHHSRSAEDLSILDAKRKENFGDDVENKVVMEHEEKEGSLENNNKVGDETPADDNFDTYNYVGSAKDWILPGMDEVTMKRHVNGESAFSRWKELTGEDYRTKRIEEWVTDLQYCGKFEEVDNFFVPGGDGPQVQKGKAVLDAPPPAAKLDSGKVNPGTESVKKYISSLSANATSAQLINHGLVKIPFLSAFVSLRALNISGNSIARITAGALPRGLHVLNLSRNSISVIEGLRELTRLRILDLSYNRLVRIGHGLASCSSLKELYLAGNKISEVEGLHRLLKLNVLDLRFNKISTAKCVGQLAANFASLQAISLEGNPAQKNVGDEQLKKHLHGLLPNLIYFNRKPVKVKDTADRSARLASGLKADLKAMRKSTHKASSSSTHGRKSQPMTTSKPSKRGFARLPPIAAAKTTSAKQHVYDLSSKLLSFRPDLSMRRSRSEGTLTASQ